MVLRPFHNRLFHKFELEVWRPGVRWLDNHHWRALPVRTVKWLKYYYKNICSLTRIDHQQLVLFHRGSHMTATEIWSPCLSTWTTTAVAKITQSQPRALRIVVPLKCAPFLGGQWHKRTYCVGHRRAAADTTEQSGHIIVRGRSARPVVRRRPVVNHVHAAVFQPNHHHQGPRVVPRSCFRPTS